MTLPELLTEWLTSHRALSFCLDDDCIFMAKLYHQYQQHMHDV